MSKLSCGISIPGVTEKDGRYYKIVKNKWVKLTRIDEGINALYRALHELDPLKPGTISELIGLYRAMGMDELSEATRKDYLNILKRLEIGFGRMKVDTLRPNQVSNYLERRRKAGRGATRANREVAVLSAVHQFGMRNLACEYNPCRGTSRNTESPKQRYVTNEEFLDAFNRSNEAFQELLALAYLTGCRQTDLIAWSRTGNLTPKGIDYRQSKTGKQHLVSWSDAVRHFARRAMERAPHSDLVLTNTRGEPWTVSGIASQIKRLKCTWTFKDLRAKAQSDSAHSVLGHGAALEATYRKVLRTVPVR